MAALSYGGVALTPTFNGVPTGTNNAALQTASAIGPTQAQQYGGSVVNNGGPVSFGVTSVSIPVQARLLTLQSGTIKALPPKT